MGLEAIQGGRLEPGARVVVHGERGSRSATVVASAFKSHVFRDDVSVRYPDGTLDLIPVERVRRETANS